MVERCDSCLAASLFSHRITGFLASACTPGCARAWARSRPQPELRGIRAVVQCFLCSAVPAAAPPTSRFMALLIDLLAVRAQALLPPFSSVCGRVVFFSLFCCPPSVPQAQILPMRSCTSPASHSCRCRFLTRHFYQTPWEPPPVEISSDIGTGCPKTGDN